MVGLVVVVGWETTVKVVDVVEAISHYAEEASAEAGGGRCVFRFDVMCGGFACFWINRSLFHDFLADLVPGVFRIRPTNSLRK